MGYRVYHEQNFKHAEDDYRGFEPSDDEGARGPLILALAGGVLLIFGAVIWNTYKQGVRAESGQLPYIYADASPYKRAPSDPGGVTAPDQERRIYDQIDGSVRAPAEPAFADPEPGKVLQGGPPIDLRPGEETDLDETTGIPRAALPRVAELENLENLPDAPPENEVETVVETAASAAPTVEPEPVKSAFNFNASGNYLVQIAALRSQEAAEAAWQAASGKHPAVYAGAEKQIQRADLGAKGVFYRLRVGAFAERSDASGFCDALKEKGETCIVVSG